MFIKKQLRNESGAALIWAMCAATIVLILVGASMTLATAYHERTLRETATKQSYFSALSAAELVANEIVNGKSYATVEELISSSTLIPDKGTTKENAHTMNIVFSNDDTSPMGQCSVWVYWKDDTTLVIESDAQFKDTSDSVSIEIGYYSSQSNSESGESSNRSIFGTRRSLNSTSNVVFKNTDIYLMDIDYSYKINWILNENNNIYAGKSAYQTLLDSLLGWFPWLGNIFGDISMSDFTIITDSDYTKVVNNNIKTIPSGADIIEITSSRATEVENLLSNLQPGKIYVINYTNRNNQLNLNMGFEDSQTGESQVYFVRPIGTRGVINVETIEEGIEFYYYGYDTSGQLNFGKSDTILNMIGGIYSNDNIGILGDVNYSGYFFMEKSNPRLNFTGNTFFNIGYAQRNTLNYSWDINKYYTLQSD